MNEREVGEAPVATNSSSDLQKELAEVLRQRAAISAVLRAIANSPHDLQPIFDAILDSATHLCRVDAGTFRLVEKAGFRIVAHKHPAETEENMPPRLLGYGSWFDRLFAGKSPIHIPDLAAHELYSAGEALAVAQVKRGLRTLLLVPMLRNDELIGTLAISRKRVEPFIFFHIQGRCQRSVRRGSRPGAHPKGYA